MKQIAETLIAFAIERLDILILKNPVLSPTGKQMDAIANISKSDISQLIKSGKERKADITLV